MSEEQVETTVVENSAQEVSIEDMITKWKRAYGEDNVYMIELGGIDYYYRALTRQEFRNMMKVASSRQMDANFDMEETIVQWGVLHPKINATAITSMLAGVVATLSSAIMEASGFDEVAVPVKL